jgi:hypothetical protein
MFSDSLNNPKISNFYFDKLNIDKTDILPFINLSIDTSESKETYITDSYSKMFM